MKCGNKECVDYDHVSNNYCRLWDDTNKCSEKEDSVEEICIEKLTIEELRAQFEFRYINIDKSKRGETKLYTDLTTQFKFDVWVDCADTNKIIKE
jgi:hypothetical protein